MLSGLPTGFAARAAEDTLCYRIPAATAREVLARPAAMRFVARSLLSWPVRARRAPPAQAPDAASQPVGSLIRGEPVAVPLPTRRSATPPS